MNVQVVDFDGTQGPVELMEVRKVVPSKRQLRSELGQIDELMASIIERGLLSPVIVRPLNHGDRYEIVAGNRRYEACKRLGMRKIQCLVSELDDRGAYETSLVENLQRRTLGPMEEAKAFKKYIDDFGFGSASRLAKRIGKSPTYVSRRIALLKLPKKVQEQLLRSAKVGVAQELITLHSQELREELTAMIFEQRITSSRDVRRVVRDMNNNEKPVEMEQPFLSYYSGEEIRQNSLERTFGKYITSLKLCLLRLDEVLNSLSKDEWVVRDMLMQYRWNIHDQIDSLMMLKRKTSRMLPPK